MATLSAIALRGFFTQLTVCFSGRPCWMSGISEMHWKSQWSHHLSDRRHFHRQGGWHISLRLDWKKRLTPKNVIDSNDHTTVHLQ
jgi:hypothetical protein